MDKKQNGYHNWMIWIFFEKIQRIIIAFSVAVTVLIVGAEVFMRYIFKIDFVGYDEILILSAMWMYFIGGSYAMCKKEHISADMMGLLVKSPKALSVIRLVVAIVTFVLSLVISKWSLDYLQYATTRPASSVALKIPLLASQISLFIGYVGCSIYLAFHIYDNIIVVKNAFAEKGGETE